MLKSGFYRRQNKDNVLTAIGSEATEFHANLI